MKTDLTVSKKATINSGNYSSISPSVSITAKDVDTSKMKEVYESMNVITSALFIQEMNTISELQEDIKRVGIREFFNQLEVNEMKKDLDEALEKLTNIDWSVI